EDAGLELRPGAEKRAQEPKSVRRPRPQARCWFGTGESQGAPSANSGHVPAARLESGSPSKEPLTFSWTAARIFRGGLPVQRKFPRLLRQIGGSPSMGGWLNLRLPAQCPDRTCHGNCCPPPAR